MLNLLKMKLLDDIIFFNFRFQINDMGFDHEKKNKKNRSEKQTNKQSHALACGAFLQLDLHITD